MLTGGCGAAAGIVRARCSAAAAAAKCPVESSRSCCVSFDAAVADDDDGEKDAVAPPADKDAVAGATTTPDPPPPAAADQKIGELERQLAETRGQLAAIQQAVAKQQPEAQQQAQPPAGQQMSLSVSPPPSVAKKTSLDGMVYPVGVPSCEYSSSELQRKRVTATGTDLHVILYRTHSKLVEKKRVGDPDAGSFGPDGGYVPPSGVDRIQIVSDKSPVTVIESRR